MSYTQDMAAWQREWMERYEPDPEVGYPLNDITPWWETGELVYARVKPGAPPRPRRQRNPAIEEVTPEKQAAIDSILPEQGSRARVR